MHAGTDDDDHETSTCYRHPSHETALSCLECDRPICVDCANHGPVGIKCPECSRTSRAARGGVPVQRMARAMVVAAVVASSLGTLLFVVRVPFLGIILAYLVGVATGEATRRASGGYRDPVLARGAAIAAGVGVAAFPVLAVLAGRASAGFLFWTVVAAGFAAYAAHGRAS